MGRMVPRHSHVFGENVSSPSFWQVFSRGHGICRRCTASLHRLQNTGRLAQIEAKSRCASSAWFVLQYPAHVLHRYTEPKATVCCRLVVYNVSPLHNSRCRCHARRIRALWLHCWKRTMNWGCRVEALQKQSDCTRFLHLIKVRLHQLNTERVKVPSRCSRATGRSWKLTLQLLSCNVCPCTLPPCFS